MGGIWGWPEITASVRGFQARDGRTLCFVKSWGWGYKACSSIVSELTGKETATKSVAGGRRKKKAVWTGEVMFTTKVPNGCSSEETEIPIRQDLAFQGHRAPCHGGYWRGELVWPWVKTSEPVISRKLQDFYQGREAPNSQLFGFQEILFLLFTPVPWSLCKAYNRLSGRWNIRKSRCFPQMLRFPPAEQQMAAKSQKGSREHTRTQKC